LKARFIGAAVLLVPLFCNAETCRVVEYAELKDMSTNELRLLGETHYSTMMEIEMLAKFENSSAKVAISSAQASTCSAEAERIAKLLKKRKDLKRVLKNRLRSTLWGGEFIEKYKLE